jgi:hypothetical protein
MSFLKMSRNLAFILVHTWTWHSKFV